MKKGYVQLPYDFAARRDGFLRRSEQFLLYAILIAVVLGTTNFSNFFNSPRSNGRGQNKVAISSVELAAGHARCLLDQQRPIVDYNLAQDRLTKLSNNDASRRLILKNAVLIDGDGEARGNGSLVIRDGIIEKILDASEGLSLQPDDQVMDIAYRYVTPGLIEMHSHAGVREIPQMWANEDVTELSSPITPWARAIDAYKSYDVGIDLVAGGGVTTSLVLTGAQSIMSGEGYVFKMKRGDSPYDVLVNTSRDAGGKPQRYMKMALGENIKKTWGNKPGGPTTRQGISFYFRRAMEKARNLLREQDRWCQSLASMNEGGYMSNPYPESLESQNLVDLMRGDFRLNVHCYETQDVYSLFDHSDEFGFKISAIHHALASHLMIDELKKRNVTVATFSDEWGFKIELYDTSYTRLPKAIVDAGIPLVLTTDHPSTYGKLLMYVAQVAYHYGVSSELAIASLIAEPARGLGLDNRLGFLRPGYDADLVVWDKHPLRMGSTPLGVIIDGELIINSTSALWEDRQPLNSDIPPPQAPQGTNGHESCVPGAKNLIIQGISDDYFNEDNSDMASDGDDSLQAIAVIQDGQLECVGKGHCRELAQRLSAGKHFRLMNVTNGVVAPGLTVITRQYGLGEIPYEDSTMNGKNSGQDLNSPEFTKEALRFGEQHLDRCHRKGVTRLITPPMTDGFFHGVSSSFRSGAQSILDSDAVYVDDLALHFTIGHAGKEDSIPTVSKQIHLLRDLLTDKKALHPLYEKASEGTLPVVVHTDNKDIIAQMIKLKRDTGAHIIIMGGAEAHLVAEDLATSEIPVILTSGWCHPFTWDERRCLVGPPITELGTADVLLQAGVLLGMGNWDYRQGHVEDILWEASWTFGGKNPKVAMDMVTRNVDKMFGLDGSTKDVVIHEGNPLDLGSRIALVLEAGAVQRCWPDVEPPRGS